MRGADIIAKKLAAAGCKRAFGIPGGEVLAIMDALGGAGIEFTLAKHENAAGFMAEGAWQADSNGGASAAPGILLATIGPGVTNAVNVVTNAHQERVPLIFLTGCVNDTDVATYTHQVFDHAAMLRPIVKASFRAAAGACDAIIEKAIAVAMEGQPGPVHIDLPIDVMEAETDEVALPLSAAPLVSIPVDLKAAKDLIARAKSPLVIAGVDAVNEGAGAAIAAFCFQTGAPLLTSYKGKGLLDESDALSLGGHGLSPKSDAILAPLFAEADLVILAGYDPIEMRKGWRTPWRAETPVIEITPVTRTHGMHAPVAVQFRAGVAETLGALDVMPDGPIWASGMPAKVRAELAEAFSAPDTWGAAVAFETLADALPTGTVATADAGAHRILLSQMWRCAGARTLLQSSAFCTMGGAVPLAMGHAIAQPETPVVAFVGDAGMEMVLGELATLRDLRLPVMIAVMVDESLALIEKKQRGMQLGNLGVDFGATDFPAVANALGGHGVWIEDVDTLRAEASEALTRDTFTLFAIRIGRRAYEGAF